ncbi:hypothetical protein F4805DRAFT_418241 [Annulohypoxylon moriforme]|nr:hypothetical protein F4805DRAFT_418241 [Annulohypoxylon moriforme]
MSGQALNFDRLRDEELSLLSLDDELDIVDLFESVINSSPNHDIKEISQRFIDGLIKLAPGKSLDTQTLPRSTWFTLNRIAACIDRGHYGQDVLVTTVRKLNEVEGWKDLPEFWIAMRECWNLSPTNNLEAKDEMEFTAEEWLNLNSFAARLYNGPHVGCLISFASCELSEGLEGEPKDDDRPEPETRLQVSCEWIVHSGWRLIRESLLNSYTDPKEKLESRYSNPYSIGPLFTGLRGFSLERWGFWKRRLFELREDNIYGEITYKSIDEAIEVMTGIERDILEKSNIDVLFFP